MSNRRSLVDGIRPTTPPVDPRKEAEFVYGKSQSTTAENQKPLNHQGRVPLTTRIRADMFDALKRASLQRQLSKTEPNTVQDILETALEPWLKEQGYL